MFYVKQRLALNCFRMFPGKTSWQNILDVIIAQ